MLVLPVGDFSPVAPVKPVAPVAPRKAKGLDKAGAAIPPARTATAMASSSTRAALDNIKLGG